MGLPYRYREKIERAVVELLDTYGIHCYPIYPRIIATKMGIDVARYQDYPESAQIKFCNLSQDAFTAFDYYQKRYRIYFHDSGNKKHHRERFSLCHEIGHAWLEHSANSKLAEQEADYFAGYLLMPHPAIFALGMTPWMISECFATSTATAKYAYNQAVERQKMEGLTVKPHERWILDNAQIRTTGQI